MAILSTPWGGFVVGNSSNKGLEACMNMRADCGNRAEADELSDCIVARLEADFCMKYCYGISILLKRQKYFALKWLWKRFNEDITY